MMNRTSSFVLMGAALLVCSPVHVERRKNQHLYTVEARKQAVLTEFDATEKGGIGDLIWMRASRAPGAGRQIPDLFFQENRRKGKVYEEVWFGPGNFRLVGREDLDGNGTLETMVYYNGAAAGGFVGSVIARLELDTLSAGRTDIWVYPGRRMELDTDGDGKPDRVQDEPRLTVANFSALTRTMRIAGLVHQPLNPARSWALHPSLISEPRFRAVIPHSLPRGSSRAANP